ncbi:MAG: ArsR family transcriptional regulator [Saliniramus fredricksonii]|uniref:ArsR family transcriptional regulator n=1 Tax=Saliniramus fredricksonii TaxID=1653334 RepID=A0A0P7ZX88_9HYPH|nr:metalloregulator ArsR/SmtB family transcription factor [Saliniramus fredricksonii]KPQ09457.1 MAG: ArsR family transcriptional regulator [Saliniramus fredricksonii]SCC78543.1 DNA-binding transcriptional regulator, ArsR family [Saliniramus fredricksonii]
MMQMKTPLPDVDLATMAAQLEALGHPTRLALYRLMVRAGPEGIPVGRLQEALGIPASTLSHHLAKLTAQGLVSRERQATTLICRADFETMHGLVGFLNDECCADSCTRALPVAPVVADGDA